jgi:polyhydroxybutyrate depolymerase
MKTELGSPFRLIPRQHRAMPLTKPGQIIALFLAALLLALSPVACREEVPTPARNYTDSMQSGGLERTYLVHVPPTSSTTKPMPLLIVLHGAGGTGQGMVSLTFGGFNTLADNEKFIVVYPDGIDKQWNDGREGDFTVVDREEIDDVGFISALIDRLSQKHNIDGKRIYVTGMSNGAMMSYRLACELSYRIAAVAPVCGAMPLDSVSQCSPVRPISVLVISGTEDRLVPWDGGSVIGGRGQVLSVPDSVKYWVTYNQCSATPEVTMEADTDPQDGTRVRKEVYGQGKDGTEVILYAIEGGGHTWPGGYHYLPEAIVGRTSRDIDANTVIWDFFKNHSLK